MGSQIITALAEQKGNQTTNPDGFDPDTSRPIEQLPVPFDTDASRSKPVEQRSTLATAKQGGEEFSNPIEQQGIVVHASTFPVPQEDHVLQQFKTVSAGHPDSGISPPPEGPIEQLRFTTADLTDAEVDSVPIQQFLLQTAGSDVSRPVEQKPKIENSIQVTQFDFVDLIFPPCNSIKNPVNTNILWRIRDFGFPFDTTSIIFTVEGVQVQDRDEFTVTSLPNGLQIFYDPPQDFAHDKDIFTSITISDTADPPNTFFLRCIWRTVPDTRPPFFQNISPACNSTDVSTTATLEFDVLDFGEGVDPDSISISIEGVTVCSGVSLDAISQQAFTTISGSQVGAQATGYHVTYEHPKDPWRFGSEVTIALQATDLSPERNSALFVCCFGTEGSNEPIFVSPEPEPCDTFVDNQTGLSFEVYGVEHGVDISTLEVRVDNKLRKVFVRPRLLRTD
ncbi:MAG: hypothetical protein GF334_03380 [Candidatus Altiarchaeales archaeon]|nr:hypothetical protein [Candidatus Altiarchaeales archaeon]